MHLYHIGTYWVAFERSACRLCGLFPKSELSLFCVPDCPEYVVMASVPVDEVEGCFRKHVVLWYSSSTKKTCALPIFCFRKVNFLCFVFQVVRSMW